MDKEVETPWDIGNCIDVSDLTSSSTSAAAAASDVGILTLMSEMAPEGPSRVQSVLSSSVIHQFSDFHDYSFCSTSSNKTIDTGMY